tara:strand:- start:9922 stop:11082 length:1161 start_codon:yes stop_codon:yes gene_type:complete
MRKIAVFTGTRAEYGLLYWIIKGINERKNCDLQLYVGGMHLSPDFGNTIDQIKEDGFPIKQCLDFLFPSDSTIDIAKSMGTAIVQATDSFSKNSPDLLIVLGDRFEAMAISQAAMLERLPIAHIHGGEITEGVIDEAVRHSITKMSHLHFTSTDEYRNRVIQLGEDPKYVFNVGAPGIDNIKSLVLLDRDSLSKELGFDLTAPFFLITYHPVTLQDDGGIGALNNLLKVLETYTDFKFVITYPNADTDSRLFIDLLEKFRDEQSDRVLLTKSFGQLKYMSLLKHCEVVIGNSSSGIIEAPSFNVATVNIGIRQKGRIFGETIINCREDQSSIGFSIEQALSKEFKEICEKSNNPYGNGGSSEKILNIIDSISLDNIVFKKFYNLQS